MNNADIGLLSALWYPFAPWEELRIASHFSLWVCPSTQTTRTSFAADQIPHSSSPGTTVWLTTRHHTFDPAHKANNTPPETDTPEYSDLYKDGTKASAYRHLTAAYVQECFTDEYTLRDAPVDPIITEFRSIGEGVLTRYTQGTFPCSPSLP
jgi:hypothetical protein